MHIVDKKEFSRYIEPLKDRLEMVVAKHSKPLIIKYQDKNTQKVYAQICRLWEPSTRTITVEHYILD